MVIDVDHWGVSVRRNPHRSGNHETLSQPYPSVDKGHFRFLVSYVMFGLVLFKGSTGILTRKESGMEGCPSDRPTGGHR